MPLKRADPVSGEHMHEVNDRSDWMKLVQRGLTTVLDPMVFRTGDIFLRGRSGTAVGGPPISPEQAENGRAFLEKNTLALGFFFDALVLNETLPLFNYQDSFDMHLNFEERAFAALNDGPVAAIEPVDIRGAYGDIKQKALAILHERYVAHDGVPWLAEADAQSIVDELALAENHWDISLDRQLEDVLPKGRERCLARFMLGGIIFGEYAQRMKSEHWLQPKRAKLFVQATTTGRPAGVEDEQTLFDWASRTYGLRKLDTSYPSFLALVLGGAQSMVDVVDRVKELRGRSAVADYRGWRSNALAEWRGGGVSESTERTFLRLKERLGASSAQGAAVEAGVAVVEAYVKPTPDAAAKVVAKSLPLLGWATDLLPGNRHVKLLAKSVDAQSRYPHINRAIETIWEHA